MGNRAKFYCWLIGRLERRRMTIQEICDDWAESSSNIDGKELSVRTFHRYREEIANLFGIEIECDKTDDYRYFIRRDRYADSEVSEWLLSSLRMASLGDRLNTRKYAVPRRHHPGYRQALCHPVPLPHTLW